MSANLDRIDILRILNSKGPLVYSKLQSLAGFKTEIESGRFAYHFQKLRRESYATWDQSRKCKITNTGKLFLKNWKFN